MLIKGLFIKFKNEGMALVLVLIFTAALMVLGTALISFAVNEKLITNYNTLDIQLYYIAEAGAEAGIALLHQNFYYTGEFNGTAGKGTYAVTFWDIDTCSREIISVGTLNGYSRTITVLMEIEGEPGSQTIIVRQWFNPIAFE